MSDYITPVGSSAQSYEDPNLCGDGSSCRPKSLDPLPSLPAPKDVYGEKSKKDEYSKIMATQGDKQRVAPIARRYEPKCTLY